MSVTLCVCLCVHECAGLSVYVCVRTVKRKWFELSAPNLVHVYSMTVAWHALTQRSKGQKSWSRGYENCRGRVAALAVMPLLKFLV